MSNLKREKLAELTIPELKELLQKQGLSTSGNKDTLIDRLLAVNPAGPGVMVVETVSMAKKSRPTELAEPAPADTPPLPHIAAVTEPPAPVADEKSGDAAALLAQLQELVTQAQAAVLAAQQAQKAAEDAAAALLKAKKEKKEKKGKKKKAKS